ncbi:topaz1 [Pungitius sinensis]
MLPSAGRVKLNRVALKDVVGGNGEPRRRRPPKKREEPKPASATGNDVPVQTSPTDPGNVTGGELAESRVGGGRMKGVECRTGMWDRDVEEIPGTGCRQIGAEIHRDKRMKLEDSVEDGVLPAALGLETIGCRDPAAAAAATTDSGEQTKACILTRNNSESRWERAVVASNSTVKENRVNEKPAGEIEKASDADAPQMTSEGLFQGNETELDEPESFTCQRVMPYIKKIKFSCARTYMPWPLSHRGPTLIVHAGSAGGPAEAVDPKAGVDCGSPADQNQPGSSRAGDELPAAPSARQVCHGDVKTRDDNGGSVQDDRPTCAVEFAPRCAVASLAGLRSPALAHISNPSQSGGERDAPSSPPVDETESHESTPFLSALGLSDCETTTTLSPMSSPSTHGGSSSLSATPSSLPPSSAPMKKVKGVRNDDPASVPLTSFSPDCVIEAVEETLLFKVTQMTLWTPSSAQPCDSDSFHSCESSPFLPPHERGRSDRFSPAKSPPSDTWSFNHTLVKDGSLHRILKENYVETDSNEFLLPPVLSPVTSPRGPSGTSPHLQTPGCSEEEEEDEQINDCSRKPQMSSGCHVPQIVESKKDYPEHGCGEKGVSETTLLKPQSSPDSGDDADDGEQSNKMTTTLVSGEVTEPRSYPSSDDDEVVDEAFYETHSAEDEGSGPCDAQRSVTDEPGAEVADHLRHSALDEITAYEQDILLVDVIQDDLELFENLPEQSLLKLGPIRATVAPVAGRAASLRIDAASLENPRLTPDIKTGPLVRFDVQEKTNCRSWRPLGGGSTSSHTSLPDANNNHVNGVPERSLWNANLLHNNLPPPMAAKNGPSIANPTQFRRQNSIGYCRHYFSESLSCGFKKCRFKHVPAEGDEKLCIETLTRFVKNPMCLQKAGAMFVCYYQSNRPGACFSMPVLLTLLWALLKAGMVSDVLTVLGVSLTHKIVPSHEFLLALFNHVREKDLLGLGPELMQLTFKMASAGLVLSLDCLDCVKNTEFQQAVNANPLVLASGNNKSSSNATLPEYLNLAHSIVEIELCSKQEDWGRMGKVFSSIIQSSKYANQVGRISGRIAIALLSEGKDKLSLPFAAFAETVCQSEIIDSPMRSSLGRIGVSLMLRYHKTHQWAKGRRVVEVLSVSKVNYATLKGLFGNEDGTSRCNLVTVATELFLLSGSLEGALDTLRENKWFLSSSAWPCEHADLESRTRVLLRLAEKTSHRDTLEVLCNLPGLKEPNDFVDTSRYAALFNSQLRVCVDRQIYPVASDAVDFMLSKNLSVDPAVLQLLLNKLGKQNLWLRARELFRHSLSMGYYPGVSSPPGFMALIVPCRLGEVELALSLEMFIAVNGTDIFHLPDASTSCLSVTLKRTQSCESEYLAAGSRILSAACVLQPKVLVHYTAVNALQDQVFLLDVPSARCWLRHNHVWANEVWTH